MPQYYDPDSGKPIASAQPTAKQYYDPNTGQPVQSNDSSSQPGMLESHGGVGDILRGAGAGIKSLFDIPGQIKNAYQTLKTAMPAYTNVNGIPIPIPSSSVMETGTQGIQEIAKHPYFSVGEIAGPVALGAAFGGGIKGAAKVSDILRPTSSPDIVMPGEMAARKLSAAVLPATKVASSFIKAAPDEVPNILAHAKETGNPLKTQLEFSKAAEGNAQNARNFYENQVLKPNDKMVRTSGTGFGRQTGEGPDTYASLTDIDKRIVDINKQLDKPTLNADDARKALATKTDLQTEAGKLRDLLHTHLSQATGIAPEDIANLRERVGRSYELAHDTDAAVTARMQAAGKADQGPLHLSQIPGRMLEAVWGGPVAIADRQFQRAVRNFPGEAQPLPTVNPPAPSIPGTPRPSLASTLGIEAEPNPLHAEPMNPENARAQVSTMNRSLARRGANIEDQNAARNAAASERANRLESLLKPAKEKQTVAPATRKQ